MASNEIRFYSGEVKEVTAVVHSRTDNEIVVINSASYELRTIPQNLIVEEGVCEVKGNEALVLLEMNEKGIYEITVTAHVGREKIIEKSMIKVI